MSDTIKIELYARTNRLGSKDTANIEVDREDWESWDQQTKDEMMFEALNEHGLFEWGWIEKE